MTTTHGKFQVEVGYQVFLSGNDEEIGAVRQVTPSHVTIYIEGAGDFIVEGPAVMSAHDGKLVLDPTKLEPRALEAARHAHEGETD